MKAKYTLLAMALTLGTAALAQEVDDMYFTAKDRVGQSEAVEAASAGRYASIDKQMVQSNPVNPSDSYTGRGVNPEFSAQQKNGTELIQENPDYFLSSYTPKNVNSNLYSGSATAYNCGCGNTNAYSGMGYSGFGNPYGNYYSPYGGSYSPYGGLSTMMGYGFGSYGSAMSIGMSYGMGSMYGSPYSGMYNPYGYRPNYNNVVIVTGADINQTTHGKRPVRGSSIDTHSPISNSTAPYVAGTNGRSRDTRSGRTAGSNYYDPSWRSNPSNFPTRSYDFTTGRSSAYTTGSTTGRSWNNDSGRSSRTFDSFGSGSRGSMGSVGGTSGGGSSGSSGGHSRGRN